MAELDREERLSRINEYTSRSEIPKRFRLASFQGYQTSGENGLKYALKVATTYATAFQARKKDGCSLVFCGLPGTGKTHLACAIGNHILQDCVSVKYTTVFSALSAVKATFGKDLEKSEKEVIRSFQIPELLILDEVGVQYGSDSEKIILYQIINGRYENVLPTIMISNLPEKELSDYIGVRCLDRMREGGGVVVPFDWQSYRR